ncbi:MAG TPA: RHS repeat-associated core domain-containing protein [Gemmataceae bacterium]
MLEPLETRLAPAVVAWDGGPAGTGTTWNDPVNWAGDVLPGAADDAQIGSAFAGVTVASSGSVTVRSVASAAALRITAGTFALGAATSQVDAGLTVAGGTLRLTGSTLNGAGTLTNSAATELVNGTLNVALDNRGTLLSQGNSTLNGVVGTAPGSLLRADRSHLTVAQGFTNQGTLELTGDGGFSSQLTVSSGTLLNAAGGMIRTVTTSGVLHIVEASLDNRGALQVQSRLTLNKPSAVYANSGTISVTGGDVFILQSGTGPSFTNTGTVTIGGGRTVSISNSPFHHNAGTISGAGTLSLTNSTADFGGDFSNGLASLQLSNVTVTSPGTFTNPAGKSVTLSGGAFNAPLLNQGTLLLQSGTLNGAFGNAPGGTLRVNGISTVASGFANQGTIELTGQQNFTTQLSVTSGTLTNAVGGTIRVLPSGSRFLAAQLDNQGMFTAQLDGQTTLTVSKPGAAHANSGTITFTGGSFTIGQAGTGQTFINTGVLDVGGNATLTVAGMALRNNGPGALTGQPTGTFAISGTNGSNLGSLLGSTTNADLFAPQATVRFTGPGTAASPQLLEVLGEDRGGTAAGFAGNFAFESLSLSGSSPFQSGTYVRLVDDADNAPGAGPEALYVNRLIVPAGATLDLNSFHVYARQTQVDGTVVGGAVTRALDGGPIALNSATAGTIGATGEVDEWTFFGRAGQSVTVVANPGTTGAPAALPPTLNLADVRLLNPSGALVASGFSNASGQIVTLPAVVLPADGTYRIQVRAASGGDQGNYVLALWNASVSTRPVQLNQETHGTLETPFGIDHWTFTAAANQQVTFDWVNAAPTTLQFKLTGPNDFVGFTGLTGDSSPVTLPADGTYTLEVTAGANQDGSYAFRLLETSQTVLTLGTPFAGNLIGSGQARLFRVDVPAGQQLRVVLDDQANFNRNELYAKFGTPPTRGDFQFSATAASGDQLLSVPSAAPGAWYVLLYSQSVFSADAYTLTADAGALFLTNTSPTHLGNGTGMTLTLTGAGFDRTTIVELSDSGGATYPADAVSIDTPTHLTANFAAGSVPPGTYSVRVRRPAGGAAVLAGAFRVVAGGHPDLEVHLIVPGQVFYFGVVERLYVEYGNNGDAPMPAPLLALHGSNKALFTLDESRLLPGARTSAKPGGFSDTVQINASGATPGLLQPGEHVRVPVYFVGLGGPLDFGDGFLHSSLSVFNASTTPIDWPSLQDTLRPPDISAEAWAPIYGNLVAQVGPTWGDFQTMLSDNAQYLGRLGETVKDVDSLWRFEVEQAIGFSPVPTLAAATDLQVDAPGLPIRLTRVFSTSTVGRYEQGPFGRGWAWADGWDRSVTLEPDGTAVVSGLDGHDRRFEPDARFAGRYFAQAGDHATLSGLVGGAFVLREPDGLVTRFRSDGRVDYVEDPNGNRVTATWTGTQLTRLTHSAGQFLQITYTAGRITGLTDQAGRTVVYTYDPAGEHLLAVQGIDGQTTHYTYSTAAGASAHGLLSIAYPDNTHAFFTYDTHGRLDSMARDNNAERVSFTYDSAGRVTATDALGNATKFFFDHQAQVAAVEDALGRRTLFGHDNDFNLTSVTDALGQNYLYQYDGRGNVVRATNPLGQVTAFGYTADFNRLASLTDARGNPLTYGYDSRGNLTSITYADGSADRFSPDARGEPDAWTNRRGQLVDYQVNGDGRLERRALPDGSFVQYHYNARGNVDLAVDATGATVLEYLDPLNPDRVTKVTYPDGRFLQYTYQNGRRTSMVDQDGFTTTYFYDAAGRLEFLRDGAGALIAHYHYDPAGRLDHEDKGNGTSTEYQHDAAGQLEHLINRAPDGTVNSRFDYVYDALGRRTQMTTLDGVWDYACDGIGELTRAVFTSNNPAVIPNQDLQYAYDAVGNRVRTVLNGVTTNYVTNNLNQYTQIGTATLGYDLDGNLVSRTDGGGTTTYAYDALNRLTGVTAPGGTWSYLFDALGDRTATVHDGQRTDYLIDPFGMGNVVGEYAGNGSLIADYVVGLGLTSRVEPAGGAAYFDFDGNGNTAQLTGAAGVVLNTYRYLPFGESLTATGTVANPFTYVGQFGVMNGGQGLSFMRERWYDPAQGRFTAHDPIGLSGGDVNWYRYVSNDPVNRVDPTGLWPNNHMEQDVRAAITMEREAALATLAAAAAAAADAAANEANLAELVAAVERAADEADLSDLVAAAAAAADDAGLQDLVDAAMAQFPPDDAVASMAAAASSGPGFGLSIGIWGGSPGADSGPAIPPMPAPVAPSGTISGSVTSGASRLVRAIDPNEKTGPAGFGPAHYIAADGVVPYRVEFENEADATAPAHRVIVTDQLDANLDWDTFAWTQIGFGDVILTVPEGSRHYRTTVPLTQNGRTFQVEIELDLDPQTGRLTAVFDSIDPATGLPPDALTGFLPPEDGTGRGIGFLGYTVRPKAGLPTGTPLRNVARIVFDGNDPIDTNQVDPHNPAAGTDPAKEARNTLDAGRPTSSVQALPAVTDTASFLVRWSGQDDAGGSGVAAYAVFVSDNGGPFTLWQATAATSAVYTAQDGHTYAFYTEAIDNVGNRQPTPAAAQATTTVVARPPTVVGITVNDGSAQRSRVTSLAVTFNQVVTLGAGAFDLRRSDGLAITLTPTVTVLDGRTVATLTFSGAGTEFGSLADGLYTLSVRASGVADALGTALDGDGDGAAGGDRRFDTHRLFGDIDGDKDVDLLDLNPLVPALFGILGQPNYNPGFDFDGDGDVDLLDLNQFVQRLFIVLP